MYDSSALLWEKRIFAQCIICNNYYYDFICGLPYTDWLYTLQNMTIIWISFVYYRCSQLWLAHKRDYNYRKKISFNYEYTWSYGSWIYLYKRLLNPAIILKKFKIKILRNSDIRNLIFFNFKSNLYRIKFIFIASFHSKKLISQILIFKSST